jgi:spoIIIJ-associated protein
VDRVLERVNEVEWVETTGKSVDEALDQALDTLGVGVDDAEVEILEEPRPGLFGRVRGSARVRARIRPTAPRPKQEQRRRRGGRKDRESGDGGGSGSGNDRTREDSSSDKPKKAPRQRQKDGVPDERDNQAAGVGAGSSKRARKDSGSASGSTRSEEKEREMMPEAEQRESGEVFLTGLLEAMELDGSIESSLDETGILRFDVSGAGLGLLIGPGLVTLDAVQEICRNAIQRQAAGREYGKVELDVAGARAERKVALEGFTRTEAERVLETGDEVIFDVMSRSDRKIVHDVIGEFDGLKTESVGEDPRRRVILRRA